MGSEIDGAYSDHQHAHPPAVMTTPCHISLPVGREHHLLRGRERGARLRRSAASVNLAGDDAKAKEAAAQLARDAGYDPIDCGELVSARDLERLLGLLGRMGHSLE